MLNEKVSIDLSKRPELSLDGINGNVFSVIGCVSNCLQKNGFNDKAKEWRRLAVNSKSYNEVLNLIGEYVNVI